MVNEFVGARQNSVLTINSKRYGCSLEKPGGGYHVISIFGDLLNNSAVNLFSEK